MVPSSATAYQSLTAFKPRAATDVMTEANNKYDIGGYNTRLSNLRGLVGNLQSSVEAVDPSVTGRTSGTFTTEGQRQALVSKERTPILGDLSKQQTALGNEQAGYTNAQNLATQMASALMAQDQTTYQHLLDQYNAATAAEAAAEQKRQYDESLKASKAAANGGGYSLGGDSVSGSVTSGGGNGSKMIKQGSGYAFTNAYGNPISAASYAAAKGIPFRDLLGIMARNGDKGAEAALGFVGNDYGYDPNKIGNNSGLYNALTWGTGKSYSAPKPAPQKGVSGAVTAAKQASNTSSPILTQQLMNAFKGWN